MASDSGPEVFEMKKAVRHRVPMLVGVYGVQFSGKTFGAFMLAAGLKPGGKIGFIDTENGRGSAYADDPDIMAVIPQGFTVIEIHPPFHPKRYIDAIRQFQAAGFDLVIVDSASHAWEGEGGAQDMKEKEKGWKGPKLWSKRMKNALVYSSMDIIVCLRAQEKTKILGSGPSQQYIPLGVLPICEKSLPFDLAVSIRVEGSIDGKPATHLATPDKWQKGLSGLFSTWQPQLLTPDVGRRIREWNETGATLPAGETIKKQARQAAELGSKEYATFYGSLTAPQKKIIFDSTHAENKQVAANADAEAAAGIREDIETVRDEFTPARFRELIGFDRVADIPIADLPDALDRLREATKEAA
jgi:hypothetical protein